MQAAQAMAERPPAVASNPGDEATSARLTGEVERIVRESERASCADAESRPLADCLEELLSERQMSIRELARRTGASPAHLSRAIRKVDRTHPSGDLARRVAVALGLPPDHFPEARLAMVIAALRDDAELRDEIYSIVSARLAKQRG